MVAPSSTCHVHGLLLRARWSSIAGVLVCLSACVNSAPEDPLACGRDGTCAATGQLLETSTDTPLQAPEVPVDGAEMAPTANPVSAPNRPGGVPFEPSPPPFDDPALLPDPWSPESVHLDLFDIALLDPDALSDVLSLFLDDLILEHVPPANSSNDLPYLERLCRETDLPDFRCRQRYGE